eukprot:gnl/TRDRNA2_/TRDRNA2_63095_c0_seq1.p1 gnl/TRDRNA2_/TRDRNA2_63095_c0~~gnl/TRDRNA2_/TRDRNA2_63095_c0_seq1.p1  ORF type:complete len:120 (-),score=1.25 gnl/TRDRNA2_/TRDRNA2_63095_c0_seq1:47-406(-)
MTIALRQLHDDTTGALSGSSPRACQPHRNMPGAGRPHSGKPDSGKAPLHLIPPPMCMHQAWDRLQRPWLSRNPVSMLPGMPAKAIGLFAPDLSWHPGLHILGAAPNVAGCTQLRLSSHR